MYKSEHPMAESLRREIRSRHPGLREALVADARVALFHRGDRYELRSGADAAIQILRLIWESDAFLAQAFYRLKASLQRRGVPLLPRLAHRLAMLTGQVAIGDPVVIHPGFHLLHGQVVIDGVVEIHPGVVIGPFVTIGLRAGGHRRPDDRAGRPDRHRGEGSRQGARGRRRLDRGQCRGRRRRPRGRHRGRRPRSPDRRIGTSELLIP